MKTVRLDETPLSVEELISLARDESLLLVSEDGTTFVLEEADDFDREVAELGSSEKFMAFLEARRKEGGRVTLEEYMKRFGPDA